jgi:hypothetical protein
MSEIIHAGGNGKERTFEIGNMRSKARRNRVSDLDLCPTYKHDDSITDTTTHSTLVKGAAERRGEGAAIPGDSSGDARNILPESRHNQKHERSEAELMVVQL